ncbi:hypothetical protein HPB50_019368 [Hyalomma asiaticum]|uniref:Uncharacterized protein n=1 Tax=Hyalomma asiaticum TaxID=266040 RepID=A0ACB7SHD0_HYAAI|nr:hypothetical protein HPB50_019368 [Hyalomma asiaticum]
MLFRKVACNKSRPVMEEIEDSAVRKHRFGQVVGMLRNSPGNTALRGARRIKAYKMHEYQQATTTIIHLKTPPLMLLILFEDPMRPEHFSGESTAHRRRRRSGSAAKAESGDVSEFIDIGPSMRCSQTGFSI